MFPCGWGQDGVGGVRARHFRYFLAGVGEVAFDAPGFAAIAGTLAERTHRVARGTRLAPRPIRRALNTCVTARYLSLSRRSFRFIWFRTLWMS
jgi:hypothetical protein